MCGTLGPGTMRSMAELDWYVLTHRPAPAVTDGSAFDTRGSVSTTHSWAGCGGPGR